MRIVKVGIVLVLMMLAGCQTTANGIEDHDAYCKALKQKLIFSNSNTMYQDRAWADQMDKPKLAESYHQAGC